MRTTPFARYTLVRLEQDANASRPISTPALNVVLVTLVRSAQYLNASIYICVKDSGSVMLVRPDSQNAIESIIVTVEGRVMLFRLAHE